MTNARTHFGDELVRAVQNKKSPLVVGLDPQLRYMPPPLAQQFVAAYGRSFEAVGRLFAKFNFGIIDAVYDLVPAVKPQMAFYEAYGHWGVWAFEQTVAYASQRGLKVVADAKRGDGGDTAEAYADAYLGEVPFWGNDNHLELIRRVSPLRVDALTVNGYIGDDCVTRFSRPMVEHGTGIFVVDKTSFKPNSRVEELVTASGIKVWESLAHMVGAWGENTEGASGYRSMGVVLGATKPQDAPTMRKILPTSWFLVPGFGGQGASADDAVASANEDGLGCLVNSSRGITFAFQNEKYRCDASAFASAARNATLDACAQLNDALSKAGKHL